LFASSKRPIIVLSNSAERAAFYCSWSEFTVRNDRLSVVNADGAPFVTIHPTPDAHVEDPRALLQLIEALLSAD
jgi:hypothetical protein